MADMPNMPWNFGPTRPRNCPSYVPVDRRFADPSLDSQRTPEIVAELYEVDATQWRDGEVELSCPSEELQFRQMMINGKTSLGGTEEYFSEADKQFKLFRRTARDYVRAHGMEGLGTVARISAEFNAESLWLATPKLMESVLGSTFLLGVSIGISLSSLARFAFFG